MAHRVRPVRFTSLLAGSTLGQSTMLLGALACGGGELGDGSTNFLPAYSETEGAADSAQTDSASQSEGAGATPTAPSSSAARDRVNESPALPTVTLPPAADSTSGSGATGAGGASAMPAPGAMVPEGAGGGAMVPAPVTGLDPSPPPVAPPPLPPAAGGDVATFFAALPCGAKYSALGDGGWQFCVRTAAGSAACSRGAAAFEQVAFAGGAPVTNVAQVSGQRDSGVGVVTTAGALHVGGVTSVSTTPLIASGVINYSGGYHASVALVEQGDGLGIMTWTDNGAPSPLTLPDGASPIQVSANYGLACALSTAGTAYCWDAGGNHSLSGLSATPRRMTVITSPLRMLSVGQNSVCGVTFEDTLQCEAAWYDSPFLPTEGTAPMFQVRGSTFPSIRDVHVGFGQGVVVRSDGTAAFLSGGVVPPGDNPGQPFTGVANIVASGGDRGAACVQTEAGSVFCRVGNAVSQATLNGAPLVAQAAPCPRAR